MRLIEEKRDLFTVDDTYYLAHCISADYALGAGIAAEFQRRFRLREVLQRVGDHTFPAVYLVGRVFNLVTKDRYFHKPTYDSLKSCLEQMKLLCVQNGVKCLAMPRIGCGLDRLRWERVREIICEVYCDTDIELLICYL